MRIRSMGLTAFSAAMLASTAAFATPTFTISASSLAGHGTAADIVASDIAATTNATVHDVGLGVQTETGIAVVTALTNNGPNVNPFPGQLDLSGGFAGPTFYKIYLTFQAKVTGVNGGAGGFGGGSVGSIAPGDFTFTVWADTGNNTTLSPALLDGSNPTIGGVTSDDVILAVGVGGGTAGFLLPSGAPTFSAVSDFIVCNGTANDGKHGSQTVIGGEATGCGTFNALNYFTAPVPFFDFSIESSTPAGTQNVKATSSASAVQIDGIQLSINFSNPVPEPVSISLFGAGLAGAAAFGARRRNKKA